MDRLVCSFESIHGMLDSHFAYLLSSLWPPGVISRTIQQVEQLEERDLESHNDKKSVSIIKYPAGIVGRLCGPVISF